MKGLQKRSITLLAKASASSCVMDSPVIHTVISIINVFMNLKIGSSRMDSYTRLKPLRYASAQLNVCVAFSRRSFNSRYLLMPGVMITVSLTRLNERIFFVLAEEDSIAHKLYGSLIMVNASS